MKKWRQATQKYDVSRDCFGCISDFLWLVLSWKEGKKIKEIGRHGPHPEHPGSAAAQAEVRLWPKFYFHI